MLSLPHLPPPINEDAMTTTALRQFVESDPTAPIEALQAEMDEQGYLFFRRIVPTEHVLKVRQAVLEHCAAAGWLDPNTSIEAGIAHPELTPMMEGNPGYMAVYRKILRTALFHEFPAHPALMQIAASLLQGEVLVHPRRIGRITWPNYTEATTPAHQDHFYIRGSVDTYSCWAPLGACPIELGGLAVWPASHKLGYLDHSVKHAGAVGGHGVPTDESATWYSSDYEPGDALFFHAYTIHKALPNLTNNRLRISTDNRYQRGDDTIDPGALKSHYELVESEE
jgi:ectoine hydroxylase-related dioxygenase (phytanoyl-CoA dioxygenase family)